MKLNDFPADIGTMVLVKWDDPRVCYELLGAGAGWVHLAEDELFAAARLKTVGFVLALNSGRLVLTPTQNLDDPNHVEPPLVLPLGCITSVSILEEVS